MRGGRVRSFKDTDGATSIEFALVALTLSLIMIAILDFGRYYWEVNAAAAATQAGVRFAVVNDAVAPDWADVDAAELIEVDPSIQGRHVPAGVTLNGVTYDSVECGPDSCTDGTTPTAAYQAIVDEMARWYAGVRREGAQVIVRYEHVGLGFAGNPIGSDIFPLVSVRIEGAEFDFVTPVLAGLNPLEVPANASSLTNEDGETN